jgi:hypothetical protein
MAEATKTLSYIPLPAISPKVVRFPRIYEHCAIHKPNHIRPTQL